MSKYRFSLFTLVLLIALQLLPTFARTAAVSHTFHGRFAQVHFGQFSNCLETDGAVTVSESSNGTMGQVYARLAVFNFCKNTSQFDITIEKPLGTDEYSLKSNLLAAYIHTSETALDKASGSYVPVAIDFEWRAVGQIQHNRLRQPVNTATSGIYASSGDFYHANVTGDVNANGIRLQPGPYDSATIASGSFVHVRNDN